MTLFKALELAGTPLNQELYNFKVRSCKYRKVSEMSPFLFSEGVALLTQQ